MAILDSLRGGPVGRSAILDRLGSDQPVDPVEREAVDQQSITEMGEFAKGLRRFGHNAAVTSRAFAAGVAEPFAPEWAGEQFARAEQIARSQPADLAPEIDSFRKVDSLRDAVSYASGALGEGLGSVGTMVAAGLLTRGAAFRLSNAAKNAAQYAGGAAAMLPMEGGETAMTLRSPEALAQTTPEERAALTVGRGAVSGLLEAAVPTALLTNAITGASGRIAAGAGPALQNVARKAAAGVVGEAGTEAAQEFTGQAAENIAVPGTGYDPERAAEAAVRGAITGGVLGGAGGTIQAVRSNIDVAAERAAENVPRGTPDLNTVVEQFDNFIRNPEQVGADLTDATLGSLAAAADQARKAGGAAAEAAAPTAAAGMDTISALRRQLDEGIVDRLTPENTDKYVDLTNRFRMLTPGEYTILRTALDSNDAIEINRAVGAVAKSAAERVPRETMQGIRNIANWAKKFGAGVVRAARERRASLGEYSREDVLDFVADFAREYPQTASLVITSQPPETMPQVVRALMAVREGKASPKEVDELQENLAAVGLKLKDVTAAIRKPQAGTTSRPRQSFVEDPQVEAEAWEGKGSQIAGIGQRAEMFLLDEALQEQAEKDGFDWGEVTDDTGDRDSDVAGASSSMPAAVEALADAWGAKIRRDDEGQVVEEEDTRKAAFNTLGSVQRVLAADRLSGRPWRSEEARNDPTKVIPAELRSDDLTAEQIGQLLGGKDSVENPNPDDKRKFIGRAFTLGDEEIASRITEDEAGTKWYKQGFNSADIAAQAGTPKDRGGSLEDLEKFVPAYDPKDRSLKAQGYRMLAAVMSLHSDGIDIPRSEIPAALLEQWGMSADGENIHIDVKMDPELLHPQLQVQVGAKESTIADLLGMPNDERSLESQMRLLESLQQVDMFEGAQESVWGALNRMGDNPTAEATRKGLRNFVRTEGERQNVRFKMPTGFDLAALLDQRVPDYIQNLVARMNDGERKGRQNRDQEQLAYGLGSGVFTPQDVERTIDLLETPADAQLTDDDAAAMQWVYGLNLESRGNEELYDTLVRFQYNGMRQWELRQEDYEASGGEPRPLTEQEVFEREMSYQRGATRTMQYRMDRQVDADVRRSTPMTVEHQKNMLLGLPEELRAKYLRPEELEDIRVKPPEQLDFSRLWTPMIADGREYINIEHAWRAYGRPNGDQGEVGEFNQQQYDQYRAEYEAEQAQQARQPVEERELTPEQERAEQAPYVTEPTERQPDVAYPVMPRGPDLVVRPGWSQELANELNNATTVEDVESIRTEYAKQFPADGPEAEGINLTAEERRTELRRQPYIDRLLSGTEYVSVGKRKTPLMQQTVNNWAKKYLDGADVQVVEFDPRDDDVIGYFGDDIPLGRALEPGFHGADSPAMILIRRYTGRNAGTKYGRSHMLAHEFGHIIDKVALQNAPDEVQAGIDRAYQRAIMDRMSGGNQTEAMLAAGSVMRYIRDKSKARTLTKADAATETGVDQVLKGVADRIERGDSEYILSRSEFFAEQFAKYALGEPNIFAGEEKGSPVRNYLAEVLKGIRRFYTEVIKKMDRTTPEFDTFIKWLGTPAAERPAFPDYDPAQWEQQTAPITEEDVQAQQEVEGQDPLARREGETNAEYVQRMQAQQQTAPVTEEEATAAPPPTEPPQELPSGEPPPPPPTEPPGGEPPPPSPPPPPEYTAAQQRAIDTIRKMLGDRANFEFNAKDLGKGIAAIWDEGLGEGLADTRKALKELGQKRRDELHKLRFKRNATEEQIEKGQVDPRSEEEIKSSIEQLEAEMQEYRKDLAVRGTIRFAAGMEEQAGVTEHEILHAAFDIFFGEDNAADRKVVVTAFTRGVLSRRLLKYFEGQQEILDVIDPNSDNFKAEEAAAYAFQVFIHDPGALQMGQKVEGIFNKFLRVLQRIIGYVTYEDRARAVFNDLASGQRSARGTSALQNNPHMEKSLRERSQEFARGLGKSFMHIYDTVLTSSYSRLANSGNPAMAQIARLGYNETGEAGEGSVQRMRRMTTQWSNRLKEALHTLDEGELAQLNEAMILGEDLTDKKLAAAQKRLRRILKDVYDYQVAAGITDLGFKDNYYPMIWSPEKVSADPQGFLDMLNQPKYAWVFDESMKTPDEIRDSIMSWESRGHEFQGIFGEDGEPVADSSRRRALDFIDETDRLPWMEDNLIETMAHYLNQSVRHAEYVRAYGRNGAKLKQLINEMQDVYGGTADDERLVKDYIDGLMGNKEIGMSRELKDLYGAAITYQNVRLLPLNVFSSLVDPLGVAVRTGDMKAAWDTFAYSMRNLFTDWRSEWSPDQWEKFAEDMGTIDMSGTVKAIDKIYTGVTLRGKTREINDTFFKWNLLNGWVKNNHIMATKHAQLFLRRSAEGMIGGEEKAREDLAEVGVSPEDIVYDEKLGRIRATAPEILGYDNVEQMEELASKEEIADARAQAERIQAAINKIVRQSLIQPFNAEFPGWMSNPYLAPIAHLKQFVFGFNATILRRLLYEAKRGNYSPAYYAAAYVPGMIAADFIKGFAGNGGEEPEWKKNWGIGDYVGYGVDRSGLLGTGQFFTDMNNDVSRGGGGWETLAGPSIEQSLDLVKAMNAKTSQPTQTWMVNALPANDLYDQWALGY